MSNAAVVQERDRLFLRAPVLERVHLWAQAKRRLDGRVIEHFGPEADEARVVLQTVEHVRDTARPQGLSAVFEAARRKVNLVMA